MGLFVVSKITWLIQQTCDPVSTNTRELVEMVSVGTTGCKADFSYTNGDTAPGVRVSYNLIYTYQLEDWQSSAVEALKRLITVDTFSV